MAAIRTPEQELARFRGRLAVAGIVAGAIATVAVNLAQRAMRALKGG